MFRGPAIDDQSDGSPWARSVEARLQKIRQGLLQIADFGSELFAAAVDLGTANSAGTGRSLARSDHVHRAPPTFLYDGGIANGTATSYTAFRTQNSVSSLPVAYRMIVQAAVVLGGNAVANTVGLQIQDESGAVINYHSQTSFALADWNVKFTAGSGEMTVPLLGYKDYSAGATCGFRLAYKVSGSNIFLDTGIRVDLIPR